MTEDTPLLRRRTLWAPALIGAAVMAGVDEIVFHQILAWHHFYDASTPAVGLLSDGLLHALELLALVAGFFVVADTVRTGTFRRSVAVAGCFLGAGAFQLWDGVIDHKVLRVHQVRYDVELLPYDIAWNAAAIVLIAIGAVLAVRAARRERMGRA